ncbi:MAG: S-layer homology domain-containing protein [Candidatus Limnocylindria bacterium]
MIRSRIRRPRRPMLLAAVVAAALAFPAGFVLASHQFSDVPNSNPFHADIDALVDSGVTSGCGGGRFCPKDPVLREQMAAFMNRLGALGPGRTPVVNADEVDGLDANDLARVARAGGLAGDVFVTGSSDSPQTVNDGTASLVAPGAGFVQLTAVLTFSNYEDACTSLDCNGFLQVRHLQSGQLGPYSSAAVSPTESAVEVATVTWIFAVAAGTNEFRMEVFKNLGASAGIAYFNPHMTALYVPFGSAGGGVLAEGPEYVPVQPEPGTAGTK